MGTRLTSDQGETDGKDLHSESQLPSISWETWEILGNSPGDEGLICAVQLLGDFLPANTFVGAGFEGGLLIDVEGGVEVTSG